MVKVIVALLVIFISFLVPLSAQPIQEDSIIQELKKMTVSADGDYLDTIYFELFRAYNGLNSDSAFHYATLAKKLAIQKDNRLLNTRAEYALGYLYKNRSEFGQAVSHYQRAKDLAEDNLASSDFQQPYNRALNGLGLSYYYLGKLDSALKYHLISLAVREKEGNFYEISVVQNNLGLVFYQMGIYERARKYYEEGMANLLKSEYSNEIEGSLVNIGLSIYGLANNKSLAEEERYNHFKESQDYFQRAIRSCDNRTGCSYDIIYQAYNGLGLIYNLNQQYDSAIVMHERAIEVAKIENSDYYYVNSHVNISMAYRDMGNIDKAKELVFDALQRAESNSDDSNLIQLVDIHREIANMYEQEKNYDSAYYHLNKYSEYYKEVLSQEISSTLERWATNVITEQDNTIAESVRINNRNRIILFVSVTILLLTSIFLVVLFRSNELRKRVNNKLLFANQTIEDKNNQLQNVNIVLEEKVKERTNELNISNNALKRSNMELDNFIYKTSHDIRGPLATLQGICNVALLDVKDEKAIDYLDKLNGTATRLNEILSKLLIINQINNSVISSRPIDLDELINQIIQENAIKEKEKFIESRISIEKGIFFKSDEDLLRIIIGNLVSNSFKFYKKSYTIQSFVEISVFKDNLNLNIEVTDNGVGVDENVQDKIFEIFSKATEMSDSAGLGLYLVKLAVEKLKGNIQVIRTTEGYTQFKIKLPFQS